jgi:hypothetical protein
VAWLVVFNDYLNENSSMGCFPWGKIINTNRQCLFPREIADCFEVLRILRAHAHIMPHGGALSQDCQAIAEEFSAISARRRG